MSKLDELWVQIHFKENSIPSVHAGPMTDESKQQIKDLFLELIGEDKGGMLEISKNSWKAELRQKVNEL